MKKSIRSMALIWMIFTGSVFIKHMPIKPFFQENPLVTLLIFFVVSMVYRFFEEVKE